MSTLFASNIQYYLCWLCKWNAHAWIPNYKEQTYCIHNNYSLQIMEGIPTNHSYISASIL